MHKTFAFLRGLYASYIETFERHLLAIGKQFVANKSRYLQNKIEYKDPFREFMSPSQSRAAILTDLGVCSNYFVPAYLVRISSPHASSDDNSQSSTFINR